MNFLNRLIRPFGIEVHRISRKEHKQKPWDQFFIDCIKEWKRTGRDPNDILNKKWRNEDIFFSKYLQPLLKPRIVVLEIGPGIGRYTRHILPFSSEAYLVDYSEYCCTFLRDYFKSRQGIHIIHTEGKENLPIPNDSVDLAFSISTFVHLYIEEIYWYFGQFHRVLKEGGRVLVNYTNMMDSHGYDFFESFLPRCPFKERSIFRFYHPAQLEKIAAELGFTIEENQTHENQRGYTFLKLRKCVKV